MKSQRHFVVLTILAVTLLTGMAHAQVSISASHVSDAMLNPLQSGRLCFMPVDATEKPTGFLYSLYQILPIEKCGTVTAGVLQSGLHLAPNIAGTYYHIYVKAPASNTILQDLGMTSITGTTWTLDSYSQSMAVVPVTAIQMGTITTGNAGTSASCTLTGTGPVLLSCTIPKGDTGATGAPGTTTASGSSGNFNVPGSLTDTSTVSSYLPEVNVLSKGIVRDGEFLAACNATSGSAVVTCTGSNFSSADINKKMGVSGGLSSGAPLIGTIQSVQSATQVTLNTSATATVTNAGTFYGTDNTAAWCSNVALCNTTTPPNSVNGPDSGRRLRVAEGIYLFFGTNSATINIRNGDILEGDGFTNSQFVQIDNGTSTPDFLVMDSHFQGGTLYTDSGGLFTGVRGMFFTNFYTSPSAAPACVNTATGALGTIGNGYMSGGGILDSWFNCAIGVKAQGNNIWISHNSFDPSTNAIVVSGNNTGTINSNITHDVFVDHNDFSATKNQAVSFDGAADVWFDHNIVNSVYRLGALTGGFLPSDSNWRIHIRNNDFQASTISGFYHAQQQHVFLGSGCVDCDITENHFTGSETFDVNVASSAVSNLLIQGNTHTQSSISSSQCTPSTACGADAILNAGANLTIKDERFNSPGQYGILLQSGNGLRILDNECLSPFTLAQPIGSGSFNFDNGCIHIAAGVSGAVEISRNRTTSTTYPIISLNGTTGANIISSGNTSGFSTCAFCASTNQSAGSWAMTWSENAVNTGGIGNKVWANSFVSLDLGGAGSPLSRFGRYSVTWSPTSVPANNCQQETVSVPGVATGDAVVVLKPTNQPGLGIAGALGDSSGGGSVSVNFCNVTGSPITPNAGETYTFIVMQ